MHQVQQKVCDPWKTMAHCLQELSQQQLDFVIHTGDMVHEGEAGAYEDFRRMLQTHLPGTPICCAMGNHDRRAAFRRGFLGLDTDEDGPYMDVQEIGGLRVISLDSALHGMGGTISSEQLQWLDGVLSTPAPRGSILILHHPFLATFAPLVVEPTQELRALLRNRDVVGIFSGHAHYRYLAQLEGIPHVTAESMAFGVRYLKDRANYTDRMGYHLCTLEPDGTFTFQDVSLAPAQRLLQVKYADRRSNELYL